MATTGDGDGDGDWVLLKCADPDTQLGQNEITILTSEISSWDLTEILSHQIVIVKANRNRLAEYSSYFHGLLCGSFSESGLDCVSVGWDLETLMNILKFVFGSPVDIMSNNFLSLFEGALFFGVETLLLKCKEWLIEETSREDLCLMRIELDDIIHIWRFSLEHAIDFISQCCTRYLARNFMHAICLESFTSVPSDLLLSCIKHPDITVESERHLADALIGWICANSGQVETSGCLGDEYQILLKEIRVMLLPLWFIAGKRKCRYISKFAEESIGTILNLMSHPSTSLRNDSEGNEAHNFKIRLSKYTKKVDLSGCPQMKSKNLLKSMLPLPPLGDISDTILTESLEELYLNTEIFGRDQFQKSSSFKAVDEVDISNCPCLRLKTAMNYFCKSFPSIRVLKATHSLNFKLSHLGELLQKFPLLTEVNLMVDISPLMTSEISILSSSSATVSPASSTSIGSSTYPSSIATRSYLSTLLHSKLNKLTLEGRVDVTDDDLTNISSFCASLCYLNLRGCTSVTDAGISFLILSCSKLHSLVACNTAFGCRSISALMSDCQDPDYFPNPEIAVGYGKLLAFKFQELHMSGCRGVKSRSLSKLMSHTPMLKSLCLREMQFVDVALNRFIGCSLEMLDVTDTKVSSTALAQVVSRNPKLKCLRAKGCINLYHQNITSEHEHFSSGYSYEWYTNFLKTCKLEEIALGWGFSSFSLEALKPVIATLRAITVGLGATLGPNALELLPTICPLLESVIVYFQAISDSVVTSLMSSLRHLQVLALCHCLGEISPISFRFTMPNLRNLQLERVTPWMTNEDLSILVQNCPNLVELLLVGCILLNSDSQQIISSGWPGLILVHLEDCGEVTVKGISSLFECKAIEDMLLRHNGPGIQRNFIRHASAMMPMLRKLSVDVCDSVEGDFDLPNVAERRHLSIVKIARCKPQSCSFDLPKACRRTVHIETLVMVWNSEGLNRVIVKERL